VPGVKRMLLLALLPVVLTAQTTFAAGGKQDFRFEGWDGPALRVFVTHPPGLAPDRPVVIVMHGRSRNADDYRDQWHELALAHAFLLVVPEFTEAWQRWWTRRAGKAPRPGGPGRRSNRCSTT
jgi:poly(3-hydroxybutyrate) depolymerase